MEAIEECPLARTRTAELAYISSKSESIRACERLVNLKPTIPAVGNEPYGRRDKICSALDHLDAELKTGECDGKPGTQEVR